MRDYKPQHTTIKEVLESGYLQIPKFQRPYTWNKENISLLWEDLIITTNNTGHFIGVLVLVSNKYKDETGRERKVVIDGQQRLITYTIFLSAIRNLLIELGETDEASHLYYVIERSDSSGPIAKVLLVGNRLRKFFQEYVQSHKTKHKELCEDLVLSKFSEEEQNVIRNYREIIKLITSDKEWNEGNKLDLLLKLKNLLLFTEVIDVTVTTEDAAFDLFETLNSRLVSLSEVDLIKNRVFMELSESYSDSELERKWNYLIDNVTQSDKSPRDVALFFKHYWWSRYEKKSLKNIFRELTSRNMKTELDSIVNDSEIYKKIITRNSNESFNIKGVDLSKLKTTAQILNLTQVNSLILSIARLLEREDYQESYSTQKLKKTIKHIEKFVFAFKFSSSSPSSIENLYSDFAVALTNSKNRTELDYNLTYFTEKIMKYHLPTADDFKKHLSELHYKKGDSKNNRIIKQLFENLNYVGRDEQSFENVDLDHILPQSNYASIEDSFLHNIGNLTPMWKPDNSSSQDIAPSKKISTYKKSTIRITNELPTQYNLNNWSKEAILKRQKDLIELSVQYYLND